MRRDGHPDPRGRARAGSGLRRAAAGRRDLDRDASRTPPPCRCGAMPTRRGDGQDRRSGLRENGSRRLARRWRPATRRPIPDQALSIFIESPWDQLNRLHSLVVELVDDEGQPTHFMPGPDGGAPVVRIESQVIVAPVPGAPNGTPGLTTVFVDLPAGSLWIPAPRRRYVWRISSEGIRGDRLLGPAATSAAGHRRTGRASGRTGHLTHPRSGLI